MYFVMKSDVNDSGVMIMERPVIPNFEDAEFDTGVRLVSGLPVFDFIMDRECQGELLDYVWTTLPGITISAAFKSVMESAGIDNVDYYPVRIVNQVTDEIHDNYYVANVIGVISCMDREKSKYTARATLPDKIRSIEELHLDYSTLHDEVIFRLAQRRGIVIVNETLQKTAEQANMRGVAFFPVEGYGT